MIENNITVEKIINYFNKKKTESGQLRYNFEKNWYRNILFYIGKQWIKYDSGKRLWTNVELPYWFPTPVTNKFASTVDALMSVLREVKPEIVASPASDDINDVNAAEVARTVIDICNKESGFEDEYNKLITWLILTGDAFVYTYYDNNPKYGVVSIPLYICSNCGFKETLDKFENDVCPNCGNNAIIKTDEYKDFPKGKITSMILSPFEVFVNLSIKNFEDQDYVIIARTLSEEKVKERWGDKVDFNTDNTEFGLQFFNSLAYITNVADLASQGIGQFYAGTSKLITVWEIFVKPNVEFPNGLHAFICNNKVLEYGDLEYIDGNGQRYIPIVHFPSIDVPKRFFSKTIADDLVYKQIQRNKLEAFIQLAAHRTSNPVWLIPNTAGVQKITGEPGEIIRFNDSNTAHGVPTRLPGVEITQSVFRWLEIIDQDFEELASTFDIIKGNVPPNVPTLGGLELLKERGFSRFGRIIENIEKSKIKLAYHWLWIWKQFVTESRHIVIKDANGSWKQISFNNSDLQGNVTLRIEVGSSNPKSEGYKQYIAGQLLSYGLLDLDDPFTRYKMLKLFHADDLAETLKLDIEYADKENQKVLDLIVPEIRPEIDNHEIHIASHLRFAKTEQFMRLPQSIRQIFENHIIEHKQLLMKQMQIAMGSGEVGKKQNNKQLMDLLASKGGKSGIETSQIEQQGGL